MALKFKLDSLDGLDEALHSLYTKGDDGKYTLQLEDDPAKATMQKLRQELAEKEKALKEREKAEADAKSAKEREDLERKGEYEKLRAQDQDEIKKERERAEALDKRLRDGARERAAMEAITAVKGIPKALLPHIIPSLEVVAEGEELKVVVKANPGQKLPDFVASLKNEFPWGFEGVGATGSGGGQPGTTATGSKARYAELMAKPQLTSSESLELTKLGAELTNAKN